MSSGATITRAASPARPPSSTRATAPTSSTRTTPSTTCGRAPTPTPSVHAHENSGIIHCENPHIVVFTSHHALPALQARRLQAHQLLLGRLLTRSRQMLTAPHADLVVALARPPPEPPRRSRSTSCVAQLDLGGSEVLLQVGDALGARDRDDVLAAVEHPRERQLSRRDPLLLRRAPSRARRARGCCCEVLAGEARPVAAEVALVELVRRAEAPRQEAAPERRVGDQRDPELVERRAGSRASTSRVHSEYSVWTAVIGCTACALRIVSRARLREADVRDLALPRTSSAIAPTVSSIGVLRVDAVLVVEVDVIDARRPSEASHASRTYRGLPSIERARRVAGFELDAELRREEHLARGARRSRGRRAPRWCAARTCRRCQGSCSRARARDRSCAAPRLRRWRRRTPTCPCSRGRSPRPRDRPAERALRIDVSFSEVQAGAEVPAPARRLGPRSTRYISLARPCRT